MKAIPIDFATSDKCPKNEQDDCIECKHFCGLTRIITEEKGVTYCVVCGHPKFNEKPKENKE